MTSNAVKPTFLDKFYTTNTTNYGILPIVQHCFYAGAILKYITVGTLDTHMTRI